MLKVLNRTIDANKEPLLLRVYAELQLVSIDIRDVYLIDISSMNLACSQYL